VLEAAKRLVCDSTISFCFVGGGSEMAKVKQFAADHRLDNLVCLPYQPLEHLSASLSAADLHLVVMGDAFVGLVHPCKIYNILELGIPFMYIGADRGHIVDLASGLSSKYLSHAVRHGDVDWVVESIKTAARSGTVRCPDAAAVASNRFS